MGFRSRCAVSTIRLASLTLILLLAAAPHGLPWGAFLGVGGIKITDTHHQILRAAFDQLMRDPAFAGSRNSRTPGGRYLSIDDILRFEGVNADILTLSPYGPGPDAEGLTLYSCHWFNPATGRGLAPQSAADWYQRFLQAILGISGGDEEIYKGLAWSAHFLADMFVPYHLNGIPADEALARMNARNFILGPNESGPAYFIDPVPAAPGPSSDSVLFGRQDRQARETLSAWWREGWGVKSNFREAFAVFAASNRAAASRPVNYLDWFDPWYWNGNPYVSSVGLIANPGVDTSRDAARAIFSSHASYEAVAHGRFIESGGYRGMFEEQIPYDDIWKNAPADYSFNGTAWQAQAWQVQDFAAKCAARTHQNAELCWRRPEIAIRAAYRAVYTMWRSAYTALQPSVQAGRHPERPNDGLAVQVFVGNAAFEPCHDVRIRLSIRRGGAIISHKDITLLGPVTRDGSGLQGWLAPVNPNEEWTVVAEVVGAYDKTPDLQYALSYFQYRPEPRDPMQQIFEQPRAVEEADSVDFVGTYSLGDPARSATVYNGTVTFNAEGTFTSVEFLEGRKLNGSGKWIFDRNTLQFTITWMPGGSFTGTVSGNTADFVIAGHWSDGKAGNLRIFRR